MRGSSDPLPPKAASKSSPAEPAAILFRAAAQAAYHLPGLDVGGNTDRRSLSEQIGQPLGELLGKRGLGVQVAGGDGRAHALWKQARC